MILHQKCDAITRRDSTFHKMMADAPDLIGEPAPGIIFRSGREYAPQCRSIRHFPGVTLYSTEKIEMEIGGLHC
jgi:hypothetical protein